MKEEWRDVVGYEGVYSVSDCGRVKRIKGGQGARVGHVLKPQRKDNGYMEVSLRNDNATNPRYVHRLVAEAFLGSSGPGVEVNHKNGVHADNRAENLEWGTHHYNQLHAHDVLGTVKPPPPMPGEINPLSKLREDQVREIRILATIKDDGGTRLHSNVAMGKRFGVSSGCISHIVTGRSWQHV